jgi:hypothetical protein
MKGGEKGRGLRKGIKKRDEGKRNKGIEKRRHVIKKEN